MGFSDFTLFQLLFNVATDVEFVVASVDSLVVDVDEDFLMKHYVQFVLGCENVDYVANMHLILMFQWMNHRWLNFNFFILTLMKWNPLVNIKFVANFL